LSLGTVFNSKKEFFGLFDQEGSLIFFSNLLNEEILAQSKKNH